MLFKEFSNGLQRILVELSKVGINIPKLPVIPKKVLMKKTGGVLGMFYILVLIFQISSKEGREIIEEEGLWYFVNVALDIIFGVLGIPGLILGAFVEILGTEIFYKTPELTKGERTIRHIRECDIDFELKEKGLTDFDISIFSGFERKKEVLRDLIDRR